MTARQWTREALDAAHPLPEWWEWAQRPNGSWLARNRYKGAVSDVWVSSGTLVAECSLPMAEPYAINPPLDVALPVILASRGMDSLGAMAAEMERQADALDPGPRSPIGQTWAAQGQAVIYRVAAMLRRGTAKDAP
jgi:hypothetical protein